MPRKPHPPRGVLENVKYELIAQELAAGRVQALAYLIGNDPDTPPEGHAAYYATLCKTDKAAAVSVRVGASKMCRRPEIRQRVNTILAAQHDKRMAVKMDDIKVNSAYVTDRLMTVVDRCMQVVPVKNGQNDAIGMFRFDPMPACKALELLGLEQGMFERKHKHLHAKANPLDGNRTEIVGRLGVLLDQLSDRDLESIGLKRLNQLVEVRVERADPVGDGSGSPVQALPEAT